jgi:hypothetical protein
MPCRRAAAGRSPSRPAARGSTTVTAALVAAVVVGEHHRIAARQHAITVDVRRHRRSEHHARQIVIAEHQRPLVRTGCQHYASGADFPQQLACAFTRRHRQMVSQSLYHRDEVVILVAECGAARQHLHVGHRSERRFDLLDPLHALAAVDFGLARQQAAAQFALVVDQNHARAGCARGVRGRQAARTAADHQYVAVAEAFVVAVCIARVRRGAEARRRANFLFVFRPPFARPHEGLVVEAGRQKARELLVDRHPVVFEARLRIYAMGNQPLIQLDFGGACIGHRILAALQLHDRIRFRHVGADNAARPVILEAASNEMHAVGEQRRGQRIALKALIRTAIKGEFQRNRAIDAPAGAQTVVLAHGCLPSEAYWPIFSTPSMR